MSLDGLPTGAEENTQADLEQVDLADLSESSAHQLAEMAARNGALENSEFASERTDVLAGTQEGVSALHENTELLQEVDIVLEDYEGLEDNEGNTIDGYDVFSHFIRNASTEIQENFIDFNMGNRIYDGVVNNARFPVNDFEFEAMLAGRDLRIEEQVEVAEAAEEQDRINIEREEADRLEEEALLAEANKGKDKFDSFISSTNNFSNSSHLQNLFTQYIKEGDVTSDNARIIIDLKNRIFSHLDSTQEIEQVILPQAREAGNYEQVTAALVSLDNGRTGEESFASRIRAWELGEGYTIRTLPPEQQIRTSTALGTDVAGVESDAEQSGNIFTLETDTGEEISYDVVSGDREISVDGYSLSSEVEDTGDYQTPKLEYMRVEQETLPNIQKIQAAAEVLSAEMLSSEEVDKIKSTLREQLGISYYATLGIESLSTAGEIQGTIQRAFRENTERLDEAREEYAETLDELRDAHMAALRRKDERVRETLRYFESIGFTQIPQYITDQVVDTLNSNSALRNSLGFSEQIDFENGELGMDHVAGDSEGIDVADRVAFAEFVNSMMGITDADGEPPINVALIRNGSGAPVGDRTRFQNLLMESGLLDVGGVQTALTNLEASRTGTEEQ